MATNRGERRRRKESVKAATTLRALLNGRLRLSWTADQKDALELAVSLLDARAFDAADAEED